MKTITEIIKTKPVFLHDWKDTTEEGIFLDFHNGFYGSDAEEQKKQVLELHKKEKILFASYTYENYSGDAFVIFAKNGELYEVSGGHCSCNGLEGQWEPEKVNMKELKNRVVEGKLGVDDYNGGSFDTELKNFLGISL